jgi:hypothetical protein
MGPLLLGTNLDIGGADCPTAADTAENSRRSLPLLSSCESGGDRRRIDPVLQNPLGGKNMNVWKLAVLVIAGLASVFGAGCAAHEEVVVREEAPPREVVVQRAPPAEVVEVTPAPPSTQVVWIKGHWHWNGADWVWIRGHYENRRVGYRWVPAHYEQRGPAYVYVPGHWSR